jgi:hypothetical protein
MRWLPAPSLDSRQRHGRPETGKEPGRVWLPPLGALLPARGAVNHFDVKTARETRTKSFSHLVEDERKRLAVKMDGAPSESLWGREMIGFKLVVLFLGAGLLLSPFFSTFGTEEAFVLLAALFG